MTRSDSDLVRVCPSVVNAYREDRAATADIQRAYLRFSWARRKAPGRLPLVRWLLAGAAVGLGVASASTLVQPPKVRSLSPTESMSALAKRHPAGRSGRVKEERSLAAPPAASAELPPAAVPTPSSSGMPGVGGRRPAPAPSAALADSGSDWQRAAAALRSGDLSAAEAALVKLEQSDSLRDRHAAELARAQLLVGRGRAAEASPTLQRLAREGVSPLIRSRAASLLKSLHQ